MRPGVSNEMLARAGVRRVDADEAKALCGLAEPGLWLPYRNLDDSAVHDGDKNYGRLRLDNPLVVAARPAPQPKPIVVAAATPPTPAPAPIPAPEFPALKLKGVVCNGLLSSAVLNGQSVRLGERVAGVSVVAIQSWGITVERDGLRKNVMMEQR